MDAESPKHLERVRDQPEIKAALLQRRAVTAATAATEARFERAAKNTHSSDGPYVIAMASEEGVISEALRAQRQRRLLAGFLLLEVTRRSRATRSVVGAERLLSGGRLR